MYILFILIIGLGYYLMSRGEKETQVKVKRLIETQEEIDRMTDRFIKPEDLTPLEGKQYAYLVEEKFKATSSLKHYLEI